MIPYLKYIFNTFTIIILFFAISCDKKPDTTGYKQEIKDREVMRVTDGQLTQFAFAKGKLMADSIQKIQANQEAVNSFINYCKNSYFIDIEYLISTPSDTTSKLFQVYDAYLYNLQNGIDCEDNLQKISGGDTILFSRPIIENKSLKAIWSIKMPKKELIKRITLKDIKQTY